MARIAPVQSRRASFLLRLLNAVARRAMGHELKPVDAAADGPGFGLPSLVTDRLVRGRTELDPEVRVLATRLVATINGRTRNLDGGRLAGQRAGVPIDKLAAVADQATDPRFLPDERAALAYAAALSGVGTGAPEKLLPELRRHFSERDIVELTMAIAAEHGSDRITAPPAIEAHGGCLATKAAAPAPKSVVRPRSWSPGLRRVFLRHRRSDAGRMVRAERLG